MAATILSGLAFGAALTAAGVYQPSVIVSQLQFTNLHMLQSFLTATAVSGTLVFICRRLGYSNPKPRGFSPLRFLGRLDGNIVGGALLGTGMALSGACPGTVFAQVALNIESGWWALLGSIAGGLVFAGFIKPYMDRRPQLAVIENSEKRQLTIHETFGFSYSTAFVLLQGILFGVIELAVLYTSPGPEAKIHPVVGGLLIGGAQLISLALRKSLVGTSGSFEEVGNWFWGLVKRDGRPQSSSSMLFCAAAVGGSRCVVAAVPELAEAAGLEISPLSALAGGLLMALGARVAGGCTSGHGISGISTLSISSIVTIAAAFVAGGLVAKVLY